MSERAKQSKKPAPWFRVFSAETITKTLGLNAAEFAVYFRLLLAMNEADEPVGGRALEMLSGPLGIRKKTFSAAVETLIERGLIERLPDGLWSVKMDDERAFRDKNSDKARTNSVKRWRKTQQNQIGGDASHSHTHREPPQGGSRYEDNSKRDDLDIDGPVSACADRPSIGEEGQAYSYEDHLEIERRDLAFATGPLPAFDGEEAPPPQSLDEYGEHVVAEAQSFAVADSSDEQRIRQMIDLCNERDDYIFTHDSIFIAQLECRDVSSFKADEIQRLESIVAMLPDPEKAGVYFGDEADDQAHEGVPY